MNLAYIIQAHTGENQLIKLVDLLSEVDTDIFLHIDKKSEELYLSLSKRYVSTENVYIMDDRISVNWSGFSIVSATLKLMNMVRDKDKKYDYISLISGQDLPIKSKEHIEAFYENNSGKEFIEFRDIEHNFSRLKCYNLFRENKNNRKLYMRVLNNIILYPQKLLVRRNNFNRINLYYGSGWFTITHNCMLYILKYLEDNPEFQKQFSYTSCADEHFFQIIIMNSQFRYSVVNDNLRYIDWSSAQNSPKTLTMDDYNKLKASDKLYARKFDCAVDKEIMDMF